MIDGADTTAAQPLPWRLMVLALSGELVPPEPVCLGPVLRHRRKPERMAYVPSFSARWQAPHGVRAHLAVWADR